MSDFVLRSINEPEPGHALRRAVAQVNQAAEAAALVRKARRPITWGYVRTHLCLSAFQGTYDSLLTHPEIQVSKHKGKKYFTWKGPA